MCHWVTKFNVRNRVDAFPLLYIIGYEKQQMGYHHISSAVRDAGYCSFQFTLSGEGIFKDSNGEYRVGPGQGFLFNTRDSDWEYFFPSSSVVPWEFVYIEFFGDSVFEQQHELVNRYGPVFTLGLNAPLIRELFHHRDKGWALKTVSVSESARLINSLMTALFQSAEPQEDEVLDTLSERACLYIGEHLSQPITTEAIAKELRVSREHLTRIFHQNMGITPYKFILLEKMAYACNLLRTTTLSIKEIAYETGDSSPEHFSRLFKKHHAQTPGQYRRSATGR